MIDLGIERVEIDGLSEVVNELLIYDYYSYLHNVLWHYCVRILPGHIFIDRDVLGGVNFGRVWVGGVDGLYHPPPPPQRLRALLLLLILV